MSIKHTVSCGRCRAEAEAQSIQNPNMPVRWSPPRGWLSVAYNLVDDKGTFVVYEDRHACPDCAPSVIVALTEALAKNQ